MGLRACAVLIALASCVCAQDARDIVRRSVAVDARNDRGIRNYTYRVLNEIRVIDSGGNLKDTKTTLDEVLYIGGNRFLHPIEKNGKPLPPKEARREKAKLDRAVAEASKLSEAELKKRERERQRQREKDRAQNEYIPNAFDFTLRGEKNLSGRPVWEIGAVPKRDYKGPHASLLRNIEGTLWIDKQDYEWVKVEADTLDTISFGLFLARIGKGTRLNFENSRINGELWAPSHVQVKASGRLGLLLKFHVDQELTFSGYRKFQTDSRIVTSEEAESPVH